ncbi:MAG: ABC transporter ATP-binding protein [Lachnospiraceae bacterium]|nr:ABC transporter ATP-binding protein [Lachnospiraceae bacterium]
MKFLLAYVKKYRGLVAAVMGIKLAGTFTELLIPYALEHMIDQVVPQKSLGLVVLFGLCMLGLAVVTRFLNVTANRNAVGVVRKVILEIRRDLFHASLHLSGAQVDEYGLPSLTSRMTSDTYNVQNFIRAAQTLGIRAPIMLIGGMFMTLLMDAHLALILVVMTPVLTVLVVLVSRYGIPLYDTVQKRLDDIVRIMRENITGIRVVKALSREEHERERYGEASRRLMESDIKAGVVMSLPGPLVTLFLNVGLTLVVWFGAIRVNEGVMEPGVILAFLTYFNMILMGVMALNRIFMMMSKANASAARIAAVVKEPEALPVLSEEAAPPSARDGFIVFDHVSFRYEGTVGKTDDPTAGKTSDKSGPTKRLPEETAGSAFFAGQSRQDALSDIDFSIPKGGSLGIIGATGSGKTTILSLLMRFYDATAGNIYIGGKDIRTLDKKELHRLFGVTLQNDAIFADTLRENILLGREVSEETMRQAAKDAMAAEFIESYADGYEHKSEIHGANFSGGQKQRILITRALAGHAPILVLDDASSALDYKTDAAVRRAIREGHADTTMIVVAQRISSVKDLDQILVMEEGKVIGKGTHGELLSSCPVYREIYESQMGEVM